MALACRRYYRQDGYAALSDPATIVALSSGPPPAAIAVLRVSGTEAFAAAAALAGALPPPRRAALRTLRGAGGEVLDRALVLVFPAARSATGEDLVELHCHGGRAVVAAVEAALLARPGCRAARPGEFTRRALTNGRIDLAQAQGLADLLAAETEDERRLAVRAVEGRVSQAIRGWLDRLTGMAAEVEASIDFGEEGDVVAAARGLASVRRERDALAAEIAAVLAAPPVERWRDGWRVVIAGPPNAGKSTLFNLLAQRAAAIVSPVAGTTRDVIEATVRRGGTGYVLVDTAGLRETAGDAIEQAGIARARATLAGADLVLWADDAPSPEGVKVLRVATKADRVAPPDDADIAVRHDDPASIERLWTRIAATTARPEAVPLALHRDERAACGRALGALAAADEDEVLLAEGLRRARVELATILGIDAPSALLDRLFERFCLGK